MQPQFYLYEDFVERDFGQASFIVQDLMPSGGIGMFHGKRGSGKTQLAFTLTRALTSAHPFLERYETRLSRVSYIGVDMPLGPLQDRLMLLRDELAYPDLFSVCATTDPVDLVSLAHSDEGRPDWIEDIREFDPNVIIIDTLRKIHRLDENLAAAPSWVYGACRDLFGPKAFLLFLHHDRKSYQDTVTSPEEESAAGSGAWMDNNDMGIHVKRYSRYTQISFSRVRYCEKPPAVRVEMDPQTLLLEVKVDDQTSYDAAKRYIEADPTLERRDVVDRLMTRGVSQAQAYKAAKEALGE